MNDVVELNGSGKRTLHLPARPVDVHTVEIDGAAALLPGVDFAQDKRGGLIRLKNGGWFPDDLGNVRVTYDHGWEIIPGDIVDVVLEHAATLARVLAHLQQNSAGSTQESYDRFAMVGVTAKWSHAVAKYSVNGDQV